MKIILRLLSIFIACALTALAIINIKPLDDIVVTYILEEDDTTIAIGVFCGFSIAANLLSIVIYRLARAVLKVK